MHDHGNHEHAAENRGRSPLQIELLEHMPFSVSSVAIGLVLAGLICHLAPGATHGEVTHDHGGYGLFHLFHAAHMFFSAAATTAMFWRYDRNPSKAIIVGLAGAVGVCGVSDIGVPHLSLMLMDRAVDLHVCVVEHPGLALPFAVVGVFVGLAAASGVSHSTLFGHSLHVLASTMASIFYLIAPFGPTEWFGQLGRIFVFVIVAVMIPCCLSDIVFPLLMSKDGRAKVLAAGHVH